MRVEAARPTCDRAKKLLLLRLRTKVREAMTMTDARDGGREFAATGVAAAPTFSRSERSAHDAFRRPSIGVRVGHRTWAHRK